MNKQKGIAPIIIIVLIVLVGGGAYAVVSRDVLKTFFEKGDKPTQAQREVLKDKFQDGDIPNEPDFADNKKPAASDFKDTIDSGLNLNDDGLAKTKHGPMVLLDDKKEFSLNTSDPVTFRWTPLVPKPKEPVTYRLKVWQLMQGQNGATAMKSNQPVVTKDVDNLTEVTVSNLYTGPCKPPYLCDFIWAVEVLSGGTTPAGGSAGAPTSAQESELMNVDQGGVPPPADTGSR